VILEPSTDQAAFEMSMPLKNSPFLETD